MTAPIKKGESFRNAEERVEAFILEEGLLPHLSRGTLLALSGGADSLFLLYLLSAFSHKHGFPLAALHVNHGLRGDASDADEALCRRACDALSVPFESVRINVASEAKKTGEGIEEAARRLRYAALTECLSRHAGLSVIATAHNATDHLETVLHHLLRGGGASALLGIRPVREGLVRPLLCLTGKEIREALREAGIGYAVDASNADTAYTRNYIRNELLPRLERITKSPEAAARRMSESLLPDVFFLEAEAEAALTALAEEGGVSAERLSQLPEAILRRVLRKLYEAARDQRATSVAIEHTHIIAISRLLHRGGDFSYAVPNRLYAVREGDRFAFSRTLPRREATRSPMAVGFGETDLGEGFTLTLTEREGIVTARCFSNLHKIDITAAFSSDIIIDGLHVRGRLPGDAYRYGGHTHRLKKLYNDRKLAPALRAALPVLCDGAGILWVPLFPVRDAVQI